MIRIVIAEDERIIRNGLARLVDWQEFGCEVVFLAENGEEARDYIDSHPVDILFTDIRMSRMDGLQLLKYVHENHEDILTFVISGYSDFAYAKEAIQYNVCDYILKPLEEEQLRGILKKSLSILEKRQGKRYAQRLQMKNAALARSNMLAKVISSHAEIDDEEGMLRSVNMEQSLLYEAHIFELKDRLPEEFKEQVAFTLDSVALIELRHEKMLAVAIFNAREHGIAEQLQQLQRLLTEYGFQGKLVHTGSGKCYPGLKGLRRSYGEAVIMFNLKKSNRKFLRGRGEGEQEMDLVVKCDRIIHLLIENRGGLNAYIDQLEAELLLTGVSCVDNANMIVRGVYARLINIVLSKRDTLPAEDFLRLNSCFEDAIDAVEINQKLQSLYNMLMQTASLFETPMHGKWAKEINMAIEYIEKNYYKKDMDVAEIAKRVGMKTRYFGIIFKDMVGKSVMKYLIDYRINIAKQLLMDKDLKAYQVAEMIGYDSYPYFSTLFKKITGESPVGYSERMWKLDGLPVEIHTTEDTIN